VSTPGWMHIASRSAKEERHHFHNEVPSGTSDKIISMALRKNDTHNSMRKKSRNVSRSVDVLDLPALTPEKTQLECSWLQRALSPAHITAGSCWILHTLAGTEIK
jgi:hypothetical protein